MPIGGGSVFTEGVRVTAVGPLAKGNGGGRKAGGATGAGTAEIGAGGGMVFAAGGVTGGGSAGGAVVGSLGTSGPWATGRGGRAGGGGAADLAVVTGAGGEAIGPVFFFGSFISAIVTKYFLSRSRQRVSQGKPALSIPD